MVLMILLFVVGLSAGMPSGRTIQASEVEAKIRAGELAEFDNSTIIGDLNLSEMTITGPVHFNDTIFQNSTNFNHTTFISDVYFGSTAFNGTAYFLYSAFNGTAHFRHSTFNRDANFSYSIFNGYADFSYSVFNGYASFRYLVFNGYANFRYSVFNGYANFVSSDFNRYADFRNSKFNVNAKFESSDFNGTAKFEFSKFKGANFMSSYFNGSADFRSSDFNGYAIFQGSVFKGYAYFSNSDFNDIANFNGDTFDKDAFFNDAVFNRYTSFDNSQFKGDAFFKDTTFQSKLSLTDTTYYKLFIRWHNIEGSFVYDDAAYMFLMKNFKDLGYFEDYDSCYFQYRKEHRSQPWPGINDWEERARKFIDYPLQWFYGYGTKPFYAFLWSLGIVLIFTLYWWWVGLGGSRDKTKECLKDGEEWLDGDATDILGFSVTVFLSGTKFFIDPPALPNIEGRSRSWIKKAFIMERVLGALFSVLFFIAISGTIVRAS